MLTVYTAFLIQKLDMEGDFFSLTKTLNILEHTKGIGMIRSAKYLSVTNISSNKKEDRLILELYLIIVNT